MKTLQTLLTLAWVAVALPGVAQTLNDAQLADLRFDQKLNAPISLDGQFRQEDGKSVVLREYFGQKPVVLVLGYYECPMLCTLTFNGLVEAMNDMKWTVGNQFTVIHVSIDPAERPALALAKKRTYLKRYGRGGAAAGWHFLTGKEPAIQKLADEVGFHYAYDPAVRQYAHPSGIIVITPDGRISKYFFGVKFSPSELYSALEAASKQKVGSPIERLVLLCFHYSPIHGKYGALIMSGIRISGGITLAAMAWFLFVIIRGEARRATLSRVPAGAPDLQSSNAPMPQMPRGL